MATLDELEAGEFEGFGEVPAYELDEDGLPGEPTGAEPDRAEVLEAGLVAVLEAVGDLATRLADVVKSVGGKLDEIDEKLEELLDRQEDRD